MSPRLVLGTAQFGFDYGIINARGKVASAEAARMLVLARESDFAGLDTAAAYGDAEAVLGGCDLSGLPVVTKIRLPRDLAGKAVRDGVIAETRRSLAALRCEQLDALLLHSAEDLFGTQADEIYAGLVEIRRTGLARRVGVSAYTGAELEPLLGRYPLDLVQLPVSVLNQTNVACLSRLNRHHVAVHIRSVFLQGVLLQPADALTATLAGMRPAVAVFQSKAAAAGLSPLEAALAFAKGLAGVEGIVVGATSASELQDIAVAFAKARSFNAAGLDASHIPESDPRNWGSA
jgi:aryl-alcohol dehydrogenase-like predicted oxidoreductase